MAGETVTYTETVHGSIKEIVADWTSGDGGESPDIETEFAYDGKVLLLTTVPGVDAAQPDDSYDIQLLDRNGIDVLAGAGANRDEANTEQVVSASLGAVAGSKLTLAIANTGNDKTGRVVVHIR